MGTTRMRRTAYGGRVVRNIKLSYITVDGRKCNTTVQAPNKGEAWKVIEGFNDFYKRAENEG